MVLTACQYIVMNSKGSLLEKFELFLKLDGMTVFCYLSKEMQDIVRGQERWQIWIKSCRRGRRKLCHRSMTEVCNGIEHIYNRNSKNLISNIFIIESLLIF